MASDRIFLSYRRDDAAGYAGRLEDSLERRCGRGSVFRDVPDIPPGADFAQLIRARLAAAHTVLVLIGPRWAGSAADGRRRIDDPTDLVRVEVAVALEGSARVVPVLLPGAAMPTAAELPDELKPLAGRNAIVLADAHWDAGIEQLVATLGLARRRRRWPWLLGATAIAAAAAGLWWLRPAPVPVPDASARLVGAWQAEVRYAWGDRHRERFEFKTHAGQLTGSAGFLGYPRAIENLRVDGLNVRFETRSQESMNNSTREVTRVYAAELRGAPPDERLAFRMESRGNHVTLAPIEFEAQRIGPPP